MFYHKSGSIDGIGTVIAELSSDKFKAHYNLYKLCLSLTLPSNKIPSCDWKLSIVSISH